MQRHITLEDEITGFDPEREPTPTESVSYDPTDPASVRAAQRILQDRFALDHLPPLGSLEPPGLWDRLRRLFA